jgi:LmbE family N-acetylglucosaminyl deacetylase/CheY-like chemotaxis protein
MSTEKSLRILLLEDSPEFALVISRWLGAAQHQVGLASDIGQAQHLLGSQPWDLLLSDIELPSGSSFGFIDQAKTTLPNLSVIVMTAQQRADYAVEALRLRVDDFLFKPFTAGELTAKIAQAMAARMDRRKSVLAIGAHPDDVELGCGGTLRSHVARGDRVHILTLCGGEAGGTATQRRLESEAAAKYLGATLTLGSLLDTRISEGAETISVIEKVIAQVSPDVIYTHSEKDGHQDHRNAFRATLVAARQVPTLLCYQAPSGTVQFAPTRFNDISPHLHAKQESIAAYASQASIRPYMKPELVEATARYWGRFAGYGLCESFEVIRELSKTP